MGCDIHAIVQVKDGDDWITTETPDLGRNYVLFSILADIRNDYTIIPICEPRGLPDDLELMQGEEDCSSPCIYFPHRWATYFTETFWLGYHSHSWLLLSEIKAYDWYKITQFHGMVHKDSIPKEGGCPDEWCGWTNSEDYVDYTWHQALCDRVPRELFDMIKAYEAKLPLDQVRLVFGFDS